jgi:hypothetical protein
VPPLTAFLIIELESCDLAEDLKLLLSIKNNCAKSNKKIQKSKSGTEDAIF